MRIYIRHAEKKYMNGKGPKFRHDPSIKDDQHESVKKLVDTLLNIYGIPDEIKCSPYLRTRQTSELILKYLPEKVPMKTCVEISEYLGNHPNADLDVTLETQTYSPPHPETFQQFKDRIKSHLRMRMRSSDVTTWYITHGIVINTIAKLEEKTFIDIMPLEYYVL